MFSFLFKYSSFLVMYIKVLTPSVNSMADISKAGQKGSGYAVVTRKSGNVQIVNTNTGRIVRETNPEGKRVVRIAVSPRGRSGGTPITTQRAQAKAFAQSKLQNVQTVKSLNQAIRVQEQRLADQRRRQAFLTTGPARLRQGAETFDFAQQQQAIERIRQSKAISPTYRRGKGIFTKEEQRELKQQTAILSAQAQQGFLKDVIDINKRIKNQDEKIRAIENKIKQGIIGDKPTFKRKFLAELSTITSTAGLRLGFTSSITVDYARTYLKNLFGKNKTNQSLAINSFNNLVKNAPQGFATIGKDFLKSLNPRTPEGLANITFMVLMLSTARSGKIKGKNPRITRTINKRIKLAIKKPSVRAVIKNIYQTRVINALKKAKLPKVSKVFTKQKAGIKVIKVRTKPTPAQVIRVTTKELYKGASKPIKKIYSSLRKGAERTAFVKELNRLHATLIRKIGNLQIDIAIVKTLLKARIQRFINPLIKRLSVKIPRLAVKSRLKAFKVGVKNILRSTQRFFRDEFILEFIKKNRSKISRKKLELVLKKRGFQKSVKRKVERIKTVRPKRLKAKDRPSPQQTIIVGIDKNGNPTISTPSSPPAVVKPVKTVVINSRGRVKVYRPRINTAKPIKTSTSYAVNQGQRQITILKKQVSVNKPQVTKTSLVVKARTGKVLNFKIGSAITKALQRYYAFASTLRPKIDLRTGVAIIPKNIQDLFNKYDNIFINGQLPASAQNFILGRAQAQARAQVQTRAQALTSLNRLIRVRKIKTPKAIKVKLRKKKLGPRDKKAINDWFKESSKRYRPSLASLILGITGYKIPKRITGFEVRPIIIRKK